MTGEAQKCNAALAYWQDGGAKPVLGDNFAALRLYRSGKIEKYEGDLVAIAVTRDYYAIGCGADYAMGAMARDATAEQAVLIAGMFDDLTSGCDSLVVMEGVE